MENEEKKEIEINEQKPESVPESEAAVEKTEDAVGDLSTEGGSASKKTEDSSVSDDEPKADVPAESDKSLELKSPSPSPEDSAESSEEAKEGDSTESVEEVEAEPESHILIGPNGEIFDITSDFQWYFVQVLSGQEDKIAKILLEIIRVRHFEEEITDVLVLKVEKPQRNRKGEKKLVLKKVYPGYILIRMRMKDENWSLIRNSNNVIDFVGGKYNPNSISQQEWEEIFLGKKKAKRDEVKVKFSVNEKVKIVGGAFANFYGDIAEINEDKEHLKILLSIFGRLTPVELGFDEVEKI